LTPQFQGRERDAWLPFASSLCGACGEVCPVKIEIPRILLDLRREIVEIKPSASNSAAFRIFSFVMRHPSIYGQFKWIRRLKKLPAAGPLKAWLSQRDLPQLPARSFREMWRDRRK